MRRVHYALLCLLLCEYHRVDGGQGNSLSRRKRYVVFPEGSSFSIALCMTIHTLTPDNIFTEGLNWGISYDLPNESKPALEPFLQLRQDQLKHKLKDGAVKLPGLPNKDNFLKRPGWGDGVNDFKYNNVKGGNELAYTGWNTDKYYPFPNKKKFYKANYNYLQRRHRRELYNKLEVIMNAMGFDGRSCVLRALCEASQRLMPKGNTLVEEMMRISFTLPLRRVFSFEPEEHRTYTEAHKAGHEGRDCPAIFPGCSFSLIDMALGKYNDEETAPMSSPTTSPDSFGYAMK